MQATGERKQHTDHDSYSETKIIQDLITHMKLRDDSYQEEEDHDTVNIHEDHDNYSEEDDTNDDEEEEDAEEEEEEEFSFMFEGANSSSIEAEDGMINHQIKPVFPLFNRELFFSGEDLKPLQGNFPMNLPVNKVFVETNQINEGHLVTSFTPGSDEITGPCCEWSGKPVESSSVACKKSNSTGFSKFWRVKDLVGRSNSDGKDTFVLLNKSHTPLRPPPPKAEPRKVRKSKTAPLSAHAVYLKNKAKHEDRRRSYLPYRPELIGFFTNANVGFTKNVHPY